MAKKTLIDIVQGILSEADGDEVDSIADTIESSQCADCVITAFENMVSNGQIKHHDTILRLDATSSSTPNVMTRPEGFYDIQWIQYDKRTTAGGDQAYTEIDYLPPYDFFEKQAQLTASATEVDTVTLDSGHVMLCYNDRQPRYYTFMEDYDDIIFDAYDSAIETNLQNSKSLAFGTLLPTLAKSDAATPDLPKNLANQLVNEARALYFDLYKDGVTSEIDRLRRRSEVHMQRDRHITKYGERARTGPDYGRTPRK